MLKQALSSSMREEITEKKNTLGVVPKSSPPLYLGNFLLVLILIILYQNGFTHSALIHSYSPVGL